MGRRVTNACVGTVIASCPLGKRSFKLNALKANASALGDKGAAAARTLLEPNVTNANQQLIRTHHPFLSNLDLVWMVEESNNKWLAFWLRRTLTHNVHFTFIELSKFEMSYWTPSRVMKADLTRKNS
ncbi:hypothetical protein N7465_002961 [Penicillium sp. CMV-2018d]|nr:hypothetical protein N7465_002961 [Penicillium sp. CMV-2018d]